MASTTTRLNPQALDLIKRYGPQPARYEIHVGWSVNMDATAETVTIAAFNVLGTENIPARDPLTPTIVAALPKIREYNVKLAQGVNAGESPIAVLDELATELEDALRQSVIDFTTPANAPSTIKQKGRNAPLKGATDDGRIADYARAKVITKG